MLRCGAGRGVSWIFCSSALLVLTYLGLVFLPALPPYVAVTAVGISYSMCASALWPSVAVVVADRNLGMAYGLMTAFQNLGLAFTPLVVSRYLPDPFTSPAGPPPSPEEYRQLYRPVLLGFAGLAAAAAAASLVLLAVDAGTGGWLNASAAALRQHMYGPEEDEDLEDGGKDWAGPDAAEPLLAPVRGKVAEGALRQRYLGRLGFRPPMSVYASEAVLLHMYPDAPPPA